jgi:gamma-glutamyltranspeptidase/glutathione hydrolase
MMTLEDLASYQVAWRDPIVAQWRDKTLLTAPLPSSGGIALTTLLSMRELLGEHFKDLPHNSPQYVHLLAEMEKRVYADRGEYLGDSDYIDVPVAELLDPAYIAKRAAAVNPRAISDTERVVPGLYESPQTTHFSIVDAKGNAVSNTYTLNLSFGSGAVVEGAGFLLNDEMDDFSIKPGVPNAYGVIGGKANEIQPGKRMLSSMTPTIVLNAASQVDMVTGSPGGSTIITTVMQSILNNYDFGMTAVENASAQRVHHQLYPKNLITFHPALPSEVVTALEDKGYKVQKHPWTMGDLQIVVKAKDGHWSAGSDARGRGAAVVGEIITARP